LFIFNFQQFSEKVTNLLQEGMSGFNSTTTAYKLLWTFYENFRRFGDYLFLDVPIASSCVTRGEQRETSAPGRSTLGAPNWGQNVTYKLRDLKWQRILIITIYKTSNVIAKSH